MREKLKMLFDVFVKITLGVVFASAVFVSVFFGLEEQVNVKLLWQILIVSAVCSIPILMFSTDGEKEISKKGMFVRRLFYFLFVNITVLGLGNLFEWFSFQNPHMVLLMEILIIIVYAVVSTVCYLNDRATAQNMNERLQKMKKNWENHK